MNEHISVNVYALDGVEDGYGCLIKNTVRVIYQSYNRNAKYECDLLYLENDDNDGHYVLVKNRNRLLARQLAGGIYTKAAHICRYCLHNYATKDSFKNSLCGKNQCIKKTDVNYVMPDEDSYLSFTDLAGKTNYNNMKNKLKTPLFTSLDFEAFNENVRSSEDTTLKLYINLILIAYILFLILMKLMKL